MPDVLGVLGGHLSGKHGLSVGFVGSVGGVFEGVFDGVLDGVFEGVLDGVFDGFGGLKLPSGFGFANLSTGVPESAASMNFFQIWPGRPEPKIALFSLFLIATLPWSLPIQTAAESCGV